MTAKEAIEKIRAMFAETPAPEPMPEPEPAKMEAKEYVLEGGQKVLVSELEIGGMVQLVDDAGQTAPAPAGDHKLADGTVITLGENGLITAISVPAVEPEPTAEPGEDMGKKVAEMSAQFDAKVAEMQTQLADVNAKMQTLADVFTAMMSVPSANPLQTPKHNFEQVESKEDKLKRLADRIASMRK
jgi:hypothetical protein